MKKEAIMYIALGILIVLTFLSFAYLLSIQKPLLGPIITDFSPPLPSNCSDQAQIATLWDYVFKDKPASEGLRTLSPTTGCASYSAINISDSGSFRILHVVPNSTLKQGETLSIQVLNGIATSQYILSLESADQANIIDTIDLLFDPILIDTYIPARSLEINSPDIANITFTSKFNLIEPGLSEWIMSDGPQEFSTYQFNDTFENNTVSQTLTGSINVNLSLEYFISLNTNIATCVSNYSEINSSCESGDIKKIWYNDTNQCGNSPPEEFRNRTLNCDFNENGIIGEESDIIDDRLSVEIFIDSDPIDNDENFTSEKRVEIREGTIVRVSFDHDFNDKPLNFRNITVEKQSSGNDFGYLLIKGIERSKTLRIDKINTTSSQICIRNRQVEDINIFSSDCDSSAEVKLDCPGSTSQFTCIIENNRFVVTGLTSSAVIEFLAQPNSNSNTNTSTGTCTPEWRCVEWSTCSSNQQVRTCTDINTCNSNVGKPVETQSCTSSPSCTPKWDCTDWRPQSCPSNEEQTQVCTDLNNCGTNTGKPVETRSCEYDSNLPWIIAISVISLFILIVFIIIIYLVLKKQPTNQDFLPSTNYSYSAKSPPNSPASPNPLVTQNHQRQPQPKRY